MGKPFKVDDTTQDLGITRGDGGRFERAAKPAPEILEDAVRTGEGVLEAVQDGRAPGQEEIPWPPAQNDKAPFRIG